MSGDLAGRTVAFVGLGNMGTPMAARLADAGATLRASDASPAAREAFGAASEGAGVTTATVVGSAAEAARGAEAVLLCLPNSDVVEAVVDGGLLSALEPGAVLVDMSSSEPLRTRALAERVAAAGHVLVDAPVSGGVSGARAGTLVPVLEAIGHPRHVGPTGAGHALKALNNLMSAAHLLASSEALLAGQAFGLDPEVMLDVVNASSGRSGSTEVKWPRHVLPGTFGSGFSLGLMVKDIRIALDLVASTGTPSRHAASTVALWAEASEALPPDADHTDIVRWLQGKDTR